MYESHWNFQQKPFENAIDPKFYFADESRQAALLKLRYAVENRSSAAALVGPAGSGKTLLVAMLQRQLDARFQPFVHLVFPQMPAAELLGYFADSLGGTTVPADSIHENVRRIERFLATNAAEGRHAVIVIDEAHLLDEFGALESLRLLSNFEHEGRPAMTLILSGQPSLLSMLDRSPQFEERMAVKCLLAPFTAEQTADYVDHRLRAAGTASACFDSEAMAKLHSLAHGLPRRVNRLADLSLLIAYAENQPLVTAPLVDAIAAELLAPAKL